MKIEQTERIYYFAYGSNMDTEAMKKKCPDALIVSSVKVSGYRFYFTGQGFAGIEPHNNHYLCGVLWTISKRDERILDKYEGVDYLLYSKSKIEIEIENKKIAALIYLPNYTKPGKANEKYLLIIIKAAEKFNFPEEYINYLKSLEK